MAYNEFLVDRVRWAFQSKHVPCLEKKMMAGLIFMVDDKMCVGVDIYKISGEDRLMAHIGEVAYKQALTEEGSREIDFTGTPMKGFVYISPDGFDTEEDLAFWIQKSLDYNKEAKSSKKRK
jgi:hypothetical protein